MPNLVNTFFILILTHFFADFALQFGNIGVSKRGLNKYMLTHSTFIFLAAFIPLQIMSLSPISAFTISSIICLSHLVIDIIKAEFSLHQKISPLQYAYWPLLGLDQALHITTIYLVLTSIIRI